MVPLPGPIAPFAQCSHVGVIPQRHRGLEFFLQDGFQRQVLPTRDVWGVHNDAPVRVGWPRHSHADSPYLPVGRPDIFQQGDQAIQRSLAITLGVNPGDFKGFESIRGIDCGAQLRAADINSNVRCIHGLKYIMVDDRAKGCYDQLVTMQTRSPSLLRRLKSNWALFSRWLIPGLGVKRWLLLILAGTTLIGVGLGVLILEIYRTAPDTWWLPALSWASLRFLARPLRAIIFGGLGFGLIFWGIIEMNRSLIRPFLRPGRTIVDTLWSHRLRGRGPRTVAIGGGHGLATLLRGLKNATNNLVAVVTVADDGGSSGRLRRELGILPPGDIRSCLAALSSDEALLAQLFQYRFPAGDSGLEGHSFGNLFISALADITGSFEEAVVESGRILAVQGRVLPSTLNDVRLSADVILPHDSVDVRVAGESQIPLSPGRIRHVWLEPSNPPAFPQAIQAILNAELLIIGPGSLYTSLLPNLLVPDLADAIRVSRAIKIYIGNIATQRGETDAFDLDDHIRVLDDHVGGRLFDLVIANNNFSAPLPKDIRFVGLGDSSQPRSYRLVAADLVDEMHPWRHDPAKLSQIILELFQEKAGPLVE